MRGTVKGRVVYLEPNDFRNQLGATYGSGDNIYWQPEDLSIAVDLQVIVPDRDSCGKDIWKDINLNIQNTGWTSFFRGTELKEDEPYLTDSFTDISYQEITQSGAGSKEALGIKSIDIQFDSHFYPVVKMRLIDVRGASLMMPAEYKLSHREETCQEFFSAIFHFPYPRFALSVKGFYGSRVTFMLAVNDFQSSFNSQTGNFEAEISFIGHMYGLYTDLPMTCLLVAPYIGVGEDTVGRYWREQVTNGIFTFSDGTAIPTFKEFDVNYKKMVDNFRSAYVGNESTFSSIGKIEDYRREILLLQALIGRYNEIIEQIPTKNNCIVANISNKEYKLYFLENNSIELPKNNDFISLYNAYADTVSTSDRISMPDSLEESSTEYISWGKTVSAMEPLVNEEKNGEKTVYKVLETHPLYSLLSKEDKTAIEYKNYAGKFVFSVPIDNDFDKKVKERIVTLDSEVTSAIKDSSEELNELSKKILGFTPSLENVVRMVFAHIDAFMHEYYGLLDTISKNANRTRKSSSFNLEANKIETDVDSHDGIFTFPPFTGFYQTEVKTGNSVRKYPGEIPEVSDFEEVGFIEKIYKSIDDIKKDINSEATASEVEETWAPLSVLDSLEKNNPYKKFTEERNESFTDSLLWFIFKRFYGACMTTQKYHTSTKNFPIKEEIENLWKVLGDRLTNISETEFALIKQNIEEITSSSQPIDSEDNPIVAKIVSLFKEKADKAKKYTGKITISTIATEDLGLTDSGFYFLDKDNSVIDRMSDNCAITGDVSYNVEKDGSFLSNVYPTGLFKQDEKTKVNVFNEKISNKNREIWFKSAALDTEGYIFPVLHFVDELTNSKKAINRDYFSKDYNDKFFNDKTGATTFFAAFLGTVNVYKFKKEESSILTLPKTVALFLGSVISDYNKDNTITKYPINKAGFFTNKERDWVEEVNGLTVKELASKDSNNGLLNFYDEWEAEGGFKKIEELSNLARRDDFLFAKNSKEVINGNTEYSAGAVWSDKNEYTKAMVELASSTVTVLNVSYIKNDNTHILISCIQSFFKELLNKIVEANKKTDNVSKGASEGNTNTVANAGEKSYDKTQIKSQLYYTLKNLYDKWLACYGQERFKLSKPETDSDIAFKKNSGELPSSRKASEVQCFMYIDTFYNDIGSTFMVDPKTIIDMIESTDSNISVMQFIANMAQKNKLLFVPLPVFTNMYDADSIASIFTPQSIYGLNEISVKSDNARGIGNTYVFMYTHESSHHTVSTKNGNSTEYKTDTLIFDDAEIPTSLAALRDGDKGYVVPAFGVTFGKQDQMYFKNINVSMANPRETDVSIANRFILADNERNGDSRLAPKTIGQNLYSIYSNRAYECTVDMMGCANIMPLMYFQLNNIPMFRGAYRIYSVRHHIENGSMTTTFSGVRISKNAIPFDSNVIDIETLLNKIRNESTIAEGDVDTSLLVAGGSFKRGEITDKNGNNVVFNVPDAINQLKQGVDLGGGEIRFPYQHKNFDDQRGACAACVKAAVNAGFRNSSTEYSTLWKSGIHGYHCRDILTKLGFRLVIPPITTPGGYYKGTFEPGDVVCSIGTKEPGHVSIYDGNNFVSDCLQDGQYSKYGGAYSDQKIYELYRYNGEIVYPKDFLILQFETDEDITVYTATQTYQKIAEVSKGGIAIKHPTKTDNCELYFVAECTNKEKIIGSHYITNLKGGGNIKDSECFVSLSTDKKSLSFSLCKSGVKSSLGSSVKISIQSRKPFRIFR